jgi:hypothetical protein
MADKKNGGTPKTGSKQTIDAEQAKLDKKESKSK